MDILLINVARIGDTLLITPILKAIKQTYPNNRLGCLVHPRRMALLQGLDFIDQLGSITPKNQWWRGRFMTHRPWEAALVYGHDAPLIRYASRVSRQVVAFEQQDPSTHSLLSHKVPIPVGPTHAVAERLLLAQALNIQTQDHRLIYRVLPAELETARHWLARQPPTFPGPLVGFQFSSFPGKWYRDWPLEHFIRLAENLKNSFPGVGFVTLGDHKNRAKEAAFFSHFPHHTLRASGRFNLRQSAAIMSQVNLYVGVDTGPTHLAGALGIPMVALYHCRFPGHLLAPLGRAHVRIIKQPFPDQTCAQESPMSAITVERVWEEVRTVLLETGWQENHIPL